MESSRQKIGVLWIIDYHTLPFPKSPTQKKFGHSTTLQNPQPKRLVLSIQDFVHVYGSLAQSLCLRGGWVPSSQGQPLFLFSTLLIKLITRGSLVTICGEPHVKRHVPNVADREEQDRTEQKHQLLVIKKLEIIQT